jgi:protease-4
MRQLLNMIYSGPFLISEQSAHSYFPMIEMLLSGKDVSFEQPKLELSYIASSSLEAVTHDSNTQKIVVVPIHGAITKHDQFCGPEGTLTINQKLKAFAADSSIDAIILDIDSGGGQASGMETVTDTIKSISKPILASVSTAASGGYWYAASCDECYATESTDIIGSIGAMWSLLNSKKRLEMMGLERHDVYSTHSGDKNKSFHLALEGKYGMLQEHLLDPLAVKFRNAVKGSRPDISKEALQGQTYTANKAQELGLIDGIMTIEKVIERAQELINEGKSNTQTTNTNTQMKKQYVMVAALLGFESLESDKDGHVSFSAEQMETLEASVKESSEAKTAHETAEASNEEKVAEMTATIEGLEADKATSSTKIVELEAKVAELEKSPGATAETIGKNADDPVDGPTKMSAAEKLEADVTAKFDAQLG